MKRLVVIDAGHTEGYNKFSHDKNFSEGTQMFKLALFLRVALSKLNIDTLLTRSAVGQNPSLSDRGKLAGRNGASMFISLHSNATGESGDSSVRGVEVIYSLSDVKGNKPIADTFCQEISLLMNNRNRGSYIRESYDENNRKLGTDYFGVLRSSALYGCKRAFIIEHGFHTNTEDEAFLKSDDNLKMLAEKEAKLIDSYLNENGTFQGGTPYRSTNTSIDTGDKVIIKKGSVYGGNDFGKKVPDFVFEKTLTVGKISNHNGQQEALLREIISWVAVKDLIKVR